jgi:PAS domain S-box-containing protein
MHGKTLSSKKQLLSFLTHMCLYKQKNITEDILKPVEKKIINRNSFSKEDLYRILANKSQVGVYIMQDKRFKFVNPHILDYTGYSESDIKALDPSCIIYPPDRRMTRKYAVQMLKEQRFSPYEFRIITSDGRTKWIMETITSISFQGQRAILGNSLDITEQKEGRKRLEELEALESSILDAIPQAVVGLQNRYINFANNAVRDIFGWNREELIGKHVSIFYHTKEASRNIGDLFYSTLESQRTFITEFPCIRKDGKEILCRMKASRIGEKLRERRIVVTYEDITEKKKAEEELERSHEELRNLSAHLQSVREKESTRIARRIHDELGQSLTALKMDLSWLESRLPKKLEILKGKAKKMSSLVDTTIESVHRISTELRPILLDDLGLLAAIEWQAEEFENRSGIPCDVTFKCNDISIDKEIATALFRIFQETLTNIARHAGADRISVTLRKTEKDLVMEVADNGQGITHEQIEDPRSFGIMGMRERASLLGGTVYLTGEHLKGTRVTVIIPVPEGEKDDSNSCRR